SERSERTITHISAVGVNVVLGPGRGVLEIVFAAVFRHPGAFDERLDRVTVIASEAFPAVLLGVERDQLVRRSAIIQLLRIIELDPVEGIEVRGPEIQIPVVGLLVVEESRVPRSQRAWQKRQKRIEHGEFARFRARYEVNRALLVSGRE